MHRVERPILFTMTKLKVQTTKAPARTGGWLTTGKGPAACTTQDGIVGCNIEPAFFGPARPRPSTVHLAILERSSLWSVCTIPARVGCNLWPLV